MITADDPCKSQHLPGLFVFSCCCVGAALKAAVVNCRACGARMLFNIIGGFHAQTSLRGSGMREAGNQCHLATCRHGSRTHRASKALQRYQRSCQTLQVPVGVLGQEENGFLPWFGFPSQFCPRLSLRKQHCSPFKNAITLDVRALRYVFSQRFASLLNIQLLLCCRRQHAQSCQLVASSC